MGKEGTVRPGWMTPDLWMHNEGSHYVSFMMTCIFVFGMFWVVYSMYMSRMGGLQDFVRYFGVRLKRVSRAAREIERKTFHLCGLVVPLTFALSHDYLGWTHLQFTCFSCVITSMVWMADIARLYVPIVRANFPFQRLFREHESHQLSGACYFSMGCLLAIAFFPPTIGMTSICYLVFGDMSAALIGVSFGGDIATIKLGREGKKSVEGSIAMLVVCCVIGFLFFRGAPLSEYVSLVGALVATAVELYEPFGLNDNLTIPLFTSFALLFALNRVQDACDVS